MPSYKLVDVEVLLTEAYNECSSHERRSPTSPLRVPLLKYVTIPSKMKLSTQS